MSWSVQLGHMHKYEINVDFFRLLQGYNSMRKFIDLRSAGEALNSFQFFFTSHLKLFLVCR